MTGDESERPRAPERSFSRPWMLDYELESDGSAKRSICVYYGGTSLGGIGGWGRRCPGEGVRDEISEALVRPGRGQSEGKSIG